VEENCAILERLGKQIGSIGVESDGRVSPAILAKTLENYDDARFAAIMAVNNETGAVMDMRSLSAILKDRAGGPIHIHCDMVQAAGKIPLSIAEWNVDSASFSAHKLGGPRGIGLLYLRKPLETLYAGGGQEGGVRPGTENTAGAAALARCLENHAATETVQAEHEKARFRWKTLIHALGSIDRCTLIPASRGEDDDRFSPYILQAAFDGIPGEVMVRALDELGFAISTGSACSSTSWARPVLSAMGVRKDAMLEGIRISQGWATTDDDISALIDALTHIMEVY
jgi:cysteine desulfurase